MIDKNVIFHLRHGGSEDALTAAFDARNEYLRTVEDLKNERLESIDLRSMFLVGFAIIQAALDVLFAVWHGR